MMMKIVHLSYSDKLGGAAIAAYRLNEAMRMEGVDSSMLVLNKISTDISVCKIGNSSKVMIAQIKSAIEQWYLKCHYIPFATFSTGVFGFQLYKYAQLRNADIIYLHWINASMLSIRDIKDILSLGKPVYWFLHDMWPMTGGCHHSFDCEKYAMQCSCCPNLNSNRVCDLSSMIFRHKIKNFLSYSNLNVVCPSKWLGECAKKSLLFKDKKIFVIPNLLDTSIFKKTNSTELRGFMNLPLNKKLILFAADSGVNNPYKGWSYLVDSLSQIKMNDRNIEVVVVGSKLKLNLEGEIPFPVHYVERLWDQISLSLLYNVVDVFVTPSLAEAFGQTALEALACGTPVVGFNIGGIPDIIIHLKNGYLADYKDSVDFAHGIEWALVNNVKEKLTNEHFLYINSTFSYSVVVNKHLEMWRMLDNESV